MRIGEKYIIYSQFAVLTITFFATDQNFSKIYKTDKNILGQNKKLRVLLY
jgi:hypothetical protein